MKKYFKKMQEIFTLLGTVVDDWDVGHFGKVVWPRSFNEYTCQLCGYKPLHHKYWLFNSKKFITILVGSECVHNWVELKHEIDFINYFHKLMIESFKPWLSVFFPEYRRKKSLSTFSNTDIKLSEELYDFSKSSYEENPKKLKRLYKKAQKLDYTLPPQLFGYGVFNKKEKTVLDGFFD